MLIVAAVVPSAMCSRHGHDILEPETHVRMDPSQSVTLLNRHTFNTSVAQDHVDNWVVLFCVDWLEQCQGLWHDYRRTAMHWEEVMGPHASSWQKTAVRFAEVDCAREKALCNENNVQNYPSAIHFKDGKFAKEWQLSRSATSLGTDLSKWIGKEIGAKLMREEKISHAKNATQLMGNFVSSDLVGHLNELSQLLSWKDPSTAAAGYFILAMAVCVCVWILGTAMDFECKTILFGLSKEAQHMPRPSALLPQLKELPEPRTIMRNSLVL